MTTALADSRKAWYDKHGRVNFLDAPQQGFGFVLSQTTYIETEVYKIQYPEILYKQLVPVDYSAPEWIKSITYFSLDKAGQAKWINSNAKDVPLVATVREKFETGVEMAAIGYDWNIEELAQASMLGMNLTSDKADAARFAAETMIQTVALTGDTAKNFSGLFNSTAITPAAVADGAATFTNWETKTADEILADINEILSSVYLVSQTVETADTLLLPVSSFNLIATKRISTALERTVMSYVKENNAYTAITNQPLMIRAARQLETAAPVSGAYDSVKRMVAYRNNPRVLKLHIPMPFRFLQPWQDGPFHYEVPGMFRLGGLDIRLPGAVRYRDGI